MAPANSLCSIEQGGNADVRIVHEQAIDPGREELGDFRFEVTAPGGQGTATKIGRQKLIFGSKGPDVDVETMRMGGGHQGRGPPRWCAIEDEFFRYAEPLRVASDERAARRGDEIGVPARIPGKLEIAWRAVGFDELDER